jgi:protease-4
MSLDADTIVDRRRMRRKLTFWRVLTIIVAIGAVAIAAARLYAPNVTGGPGPYVARVKIQGLIRTSDDRTEALARLERSSARAVIIRIDSPGGTTAGSEQLYNSLRRIAAAKPTVVVVDGLAASGGYIAAMAADQVIALDTSLVGSIGVLFQYPNVSKLLGNVGVTFETIRSAPLKAAPSGLEPTSDEARAALEALVQDSFDWFKGLVRDRRHMDEPLLARVSDGRVFTGRQAIALKLIDRIGNEQTARDWLESEKGVPAKTRVMDWKLVPRFGDLPFLHLAAVSILDGVGLGSAARWIENQGLMQTIDRLNLDGLLALWHPSSQN